MATGKNENIDVDDVDIQNYAKFLLKEGEDQEKRDLLNCLKGEILFYDSTYAMAYLNGNKAPAFEIDSLFRSTQSGNEVVECGNDTANQVGNLPSRYVDTELSDDDDWRVCTVGTHATSSLQTWYLYWTWRSLDNLQTNENPEIAMVLQPSEMCTWCGITNYYLFPASYTCAIGFFNSPSSIRNNDNKYWYQWIVKYNYNDRPGEEVEWYRN